MSESFFVVPDTAQLPIEGYPDQWIEVKRELRNHDLRVMQGASIRAIRPGDAATGTSQEWVPDLPQLNEAKALAWIVDWSLTDAKGKRMPFARDPWRNLRPKVADAIIATLDAYTATLDAETEENPTSPPASSSVNGWEGGPGMTTSDVPSPLPTGLSN